MPNDARDPGDDSDEAAAFAEAVRGARKLPGARRVAPGIPGRDLVGGGARRKVPFLRATAAPVPPAPDAPQDLPGEIWSARADGVDRRIFRKLRDGGIPIEARIDLHGLTRAKAAVALARFLTASHGAGRRCLLVVHGRGLHSGGQGAPVRDLVRHELTAATRAGTVLACGSAAPSQGGPGAALVYLRRS
jgi:DNA-nicking Smr family endonuclease